MPSAGVKARRSGKADIMYDIENIVIELSNRKYSQIERDLDQMIGFSNNLDRKESRDNGGKNRKFEALVNKLEVVTGGIFPGIPRIFQELKFIINGMNF